MRNKPWQLWVSGFLPVFLLLAAFVAGAQSKRNFGPGEDKPYLTATNEFDALERALEKLLQTRDTAAFAAAFSATAADWQTIQPNSDLPAPERAARYEKTAKQFADRLESGLKEFLDQPAHWGITLPAAGVRAQAVVPGQVNMVHYTVDGKDLPLPHIDALQVMLTSPGNPTNSYIAAVQNLTRFPSGWRIMKTLSWEKFPSSLLSEKARREIEILKRAEKFQSLSGKEDSALLKLGAEIARLLKTRDIAQFAREARTSNDAIWAWLQKSGRNGPTRKNLDDILNSQWADFEGKIKDTFAVLDDSGIDLKSADVTVESAGVERLQSAGGSSLDNLRGSDFELELSVKSNVKSKTGARISGDYVIAVPSVLRMGDSWEPDQDLLLKTVPHGVLSETASATLALQTYLSLHGKFPIGTQVPDIEFVSLKDGKKMKLKDLAGKVVVLDFWATWCGPCQGPMAELQKVCRDHPEWQDKVAIIPLSIDDTIDAVRAHVNKRGWTNTFNVWAEDGGWQSAPAKTFHVHSVPTTYILDRRGIVVQAGHPMSMDIPAEITRLLTKPAALQ